MASQYYFGHLCLMPYSPWNDTKNATCNAWHIKWLRNSQLFAVLLTLYFCFWCSCFVPCKMLIAKQLLQQFCDPETKVSGLDSTGVHFMKVLVFRPGLKVLVRLGLKTPSTKFFVLSPGVKYLITYHSSSGLCLHRLSPISHLLCLLSMLSSVMLIPLKCQIILMDACWLWYSNGWCS